MGFPKVAFTSMSPPEEAVESSMVAVSVSWMSLTATAAAPAKLPPRLAPILPARVAIDAVSVARTDSFPEAVTVEGVTTVPTSPLAMWASTVLVMKLRAKEPPKALPPAEAAPPTTTLMSCADSVAVIFTSPPVEWTVDPST